MEDERGQREILFRILRQEMKTGLEEMQTGTANENQDLSRAVLQETEHH